MLWEGSTETSSPIKQHSKEGALAGARFSVSDFIWGTSDLSLAPEFQKLALNQALSGETNSKQRALCPREPYHHACHLKQNIFSG